MIISELLRKWFNLPEPVEAVSKAERLLLAQLEYERAVNKELVDTLSSLLKPVPVIQAETGELQPVRQGHVMWTRRRAELERAARQEAHIKQTSPHLAKPDVQEVKPAITTEELERELGVVDSEANSDKSNAEIMGKAWEEAAQGEKDAS